MSDILIKCKIVHKTNKATLFEDSIGRFWTYTDATGLTLTFDYNNLNNIVHLALLYCYWATC